MDQQLTDSENGTTFWKDLVFVTFVFNTIFMALYLLQRLYQYMVMKNASKLSMTKFSIISINVIINAICIIVVMEFKDFDKYMQKVDPLTSIFCIVLLYTLWKIIDFIHWRKENTCAINSMCGLDYGTGMAYSYYYGYLKLILPSMGNLKKGLVEKIENVEDNHNVTISIHKLLILIPSSSYIPSDLKEASYQWMESAFDLEVDKLDRAGVKRRLYHNNVYKIYPDGQKLNSMPVYVVAEGATPLLTFFEVQRHAHVETKVYQKHCTDIIKNFYNKLKELIDSDPVCADLCELIYYDDYDKNGVKVNVAKVILERLSKLSKLN